MKKIAIIGAGISGLFIANLLDKSKNYQTTIYEKNKSIKTDEGYGIQLSVNSVKLLNKIGFNNLNKENKFTPEKIDFYLNKNLKKICELNISNFNTNTCKYTTLKRSVLINFLQKDLKHLIKLNSNILKINKQNNQIKLSFENNESVICDYLIISDGVFSKCRNLISNNQLFPQYNGTLAIRGTISRKTDNFDYNNISLFLDSNFHQVIYPINNNDLNFIAIMKYNLNNKDLENYSLFQENHFIKKVLSKFPKNNNNILENIKDLKIFPIFVSKDFYHYQNDNIHIIGDAFFTFPPSLAQGASQSIETAYELFESIEKNNEKSFLRERIKKTKMVNNRSKFNQFAFHLSNPLNIMARNILLKMLVKNKKFLESYLGKVYRN